MQAFPVGRKTHSELGFLDGVIYFFESEATAKQAMRNTIGMLDPRIHVAYFDRGVLTWLSR